MAQKIITGYTGTRHITPEMDASVWRSAFGDESCILATGNQCEGSMPSINEFVIRDGVVSIQGYLGYGTHTSLVVDTCATGFSRIDYVCARYAHNISSLIDSIEYVVVKGTEVAAPNVPTPPSIHTGIIKDGANEVDFPLYQVNLEGGNVTFERVAPLVDTTLKDLAPVIGKIGNTDISEIGDGTLTGAIHDLSDNFTKTNMKTVYSDLITIPANSVADASALIPSFTDQVLVAYLRVRIDNGTGGSGASNCFNFNTWNDAASVANRKVYASIRNIGTSQVKVRVGFVLLYNYYN